MDRKLAALVACSIAFGHAAEASPISQARIQELMASRDRQEVKLEALRSRDREILVQLGQMLSEKYGPLLEGSEMLFTRIEESGTIYYRMDFVGLKGRDRARALCEILEVDKCITLGPYGQMTLLHTDGDVTISATGVVEDNRPFAIAGPAAEASFNPKARQIEQRVRNMLDPLGVFPIPRPDLSPASDEDSSAPAKDSAGKTAAPEAPVVEKDEARPEEKKPQEEKPVAQPQVDLRVAPDKPVKAETPAPTPVKPTLPEISVIEYFETEEDFEEQGESKPAQPDEASAEALEGQGASSGPLNVAAEVLEPAETPAETPAELAEAEDKGLMEGDLEAAIPTPSSLGAAEADDASSTPVEEPQVDEAFSEEAQAEDGAHEDVLPEDVLPEGLEAEDDLPEKSSSDEEPPSEHGPAAILSPDMPPEPELEPDADLNDAQGAQRPSGAPSFVSPDDQASLRRRLFGAGGDIAYVEMTETRDAFVKSAFAPTTNLGLGGRDRNVAMRIPGVGEVDLDTLKTVVPGFSEPVAVSDLASHEPLEAMAEADEPEAKAVELLDLADQDAAPAPVPVSVVAKPAHTEPAHAEQVVAAKTAPEVSAEPDRRVHTAGPLSRAEQMEALAARVAEQERLAAEAAIKSAPRLDIDGPLRRSDAFADLAAREAEQERRVAEAKAREDAEAERLAELKAEQDAERLAEAAAQERASRDRLASLPESRDAALKAYEVRVAAADAESRLKLAELPKPREVAMASLHLSPAFEQVASKGLDKTIAPESPEIKETLRFAEDDLPEPRRLDAPRGAMIALAPVSVPLGGPAEPPKFKVSVPLDDMRTALGRVPTDVAKDDPVRISATPKVEVALLGKVAFDDQFAVPASVDFSNGMDAGRLQKMPIPRPDLASLEFAERERGVNAETARIALEVSRGLRRGAELAQVPGMSASESIAPPGFFGEEDDIAPMPPKSGSLSRLDQLLAEGDVKPQVQAPDPEAREEAPEAGDIGSLIFGAKTAESVRASTTQEESIPQTAQTPVAAEAIQPAKEVSAPVARPKLSGLERLKAETAPKVSVSQAAEPEAAPKPVEQQPAPRVVQKPELDDNQRQALEILQQIAAAAKRDKAAESSDASQGRVPSQEDIVRQVPQRAVRERQPEPTRQAPEAAPRMEMNPAREVAESLSDRPARQQQVPTQQFDVDDLRIELSYVSSRDNVRARAAELKGFFPPIMLEKGRFFGASVPGHPGRYVVGFEARDLKSRDDIVWYLEQMGMPFTQRH